MDNSEFPMASSIYESVVTLGIKYDHHESDLYIPANDVTRSLVKHFNVKASLFKSQIDNEVWFDIPFAYLPFWMARENHG